MKLLFIQGGSRLKKSDKGFWYTDGNFTSDVWERYLNVADTLTIVLRCEENIYTDEYCTSHFNKVIICNKVNIIGVDDLMSFSKITNIFVWKRICDTIYKEVKKADKCVIRSASFYTDIAERACSKYGKPYLFEVTGFAKESMRNHSFIGKLLAGYFENTCIRIAHNAQCAIYVTSEALQKRYPCKGEMLGCSDVVIKMHDRNVLNKRINKTNKLIKKIKIGTAAFLDVRWKGQDLVIKAIAELKEKHNIDVHYEMVGLGSGKYLKDLSQKLGVSSNIHVLGAKTHDEIFDWLDSIDIYIQPSYQEGLCRAIVEAMSRACPVVSSDAGGNNELVKSKYIFPCGDYFSLAEKIRLIIPYLKEEAIYSFEKSLEFNSENLNKRRQRFLNKFIKK